MTDLAITDKLRLGSTQATVDLNHDLVAGSFVRSISLKFFDEICVFVSFEDLFLTVERNDKIFFQIYELPTSKLSFIKEYSPPEGVAICHLSTFADIGEEKNEETKIFLKMFFRFFQMLMANWNIFFPFVWTTNVLTARFSFEITMP